MQLPPAPPKATRRSHKWRWIATGLLLVVLVLYSAASLVAYNTMSMGDRHFSTGTPAVDFSDVSFPARHQSYAVHAFLIPAPNATSALISVHGYNMSRHSDYHLKRAVGLNKLGYTVLSIDLSDNGGDTYQNGRISMGYSERWDVLGAYDYLLTKGFAPNRIGIVSESMGATTSLMAASIEPRIRAVWADSPFEDVTMLLSEQSMSRGFPPVLTYGGMVWGVLLANDHVWEVRPIDVGPALAEHHQAVYLVATRGDHRVLFHHGTDLYNTYTAAGVDVTFWDVPDLDHVETITHNYDEYMKRIQTFFLQHLA